jgi:Flp pilus assembly protein TadG
MSGPRFARRQERRFGIRSNARGTALMEFALVFPFLLVLTLSVIDLSRAFFIKNILYQAAREGVRTLVVSSATDTTGVRTRVNQVMGAGGVTVKTWTITGPADGMMTVRVESEFKWLFPGLFQWMGAQYSNPVKLSGKAVMRRENF